MERLALGTGDSKRILVRRLWVLSLLGLVHGVFLWEGDVLLYYGLSGFLVLAFRRRKSITLMVWAACLILVPVAMLLFCSAICFFAKMSPELYEQVTAVMAEDADAVENGGGAKSRIKASYMQFPPAKVDRRLKDGDEVKLAVGKMKEMRVSGKRIAALHTLRS